MPKQAISVTLAPDNLVWLKGRSRAEGLGSISECLDRLITRARFGRDVAPPVRSMRGALAELAGAPPEDLETVPPEAWKAWHSKWDRLLDGVDVARAGSLGGPRAPAARAPLSAADGPSPSPTIRRRRG